MSPNASGFLVGCAAIGIAATLMLTGTDAETPGSGPDALIEPEPVELGAMPAASGEPTAAPAPAIADASAPVDEPLVEELPVDESQPGEPTRLEPISDTPAPDAAERPTTAAPDIAAPAASTIELSLAVSEPAAGGLADPVEVKSAEVERPVVEPDRAESSPEAAKSTDGSAQTERFWGPFNLELRASSFASHLEKLIDHPVLVQRDDDGFHIAFAYTTDEQRRALLDRIVSAGLEPR